MPWDRQDRAWAIGKIHPTSAGAHLHDVSREVARRMIQSLFGRRDIAARGVIVRAEVQPAAPSRTPLQSVSESPTDSGCIEDRLWSFDHQLDLHRARRQPMPRFHAIEYLTSSATCAGSTDLRQSHHEILRQIGCSRRTELGKTDPASVAARAPSSPVNGLMRIPMNGGKPGFVRACARAFAADRACPSSSESER